MDPERFLEQLAQGDDYAGQIVAVQRQPAREARTAELERPLPGRLAAALRGQGIRRLYSHQVAAIDAARRGEHVTVVTGTASGKSLCYQVPVAESLLERPRARALCLFPTKALAQDQFQKLETGGLADLFLPATYDGDTPVELRREIRQSARVVLTNPEMLHLSLLTRHTYWSAFLANLEHVVIDEVHTYRGVFGTHMAGILRRLRRICRHYGSDPRFIATSATIANPGELVERLTGVATHVVDDDGAPRGERWFALWNPPLVANRTGERRSTNMEAAALLARMVELGVRSLTFTRARVVAELILRYTREGMAADRRADMDRVAAYRSGYTASERREIERRLASGELLGVTATNALELGIDVGGLDAVAMVGYPGTIASTRQQAGRAGRSGRASLALLVAGSGPMDQFLARHPDYLFEGTPERASVNPSNPYILLRQLACAAYELPLGEEDAALFGDDLSEVAGVLTRAGQLRQYRGRWFWNGTGTPAMGVDIRSAGGEPFEIRDRGHGDALLGTVDAETALQVVYPGAVYLHQGESYTVERLDIETRTATVQRANVTHYTSPKVETTVRIEAEHEARPVGRLRCAFGEVSVTVQVVGYRRQRLLTDQLIENVGLTLPPRSYRTEALWFTIPPELQREAIDRGVDLMGTLHAVEHAAIGIAPLRVMADRNDLGGVSHPLHPDLMLPAIFIHDAHPGGVGIAAACYESLEELLRETLDTVAGCPCDDGCPSCVQSPKCGSNNEPLDKRGVIWLLPRLIGETPAPGPTSNLKRTLSP